MKKIHYIADIRFPTEKAHGIQIAEMCHAFSNSGYEINLVVPIRFNPNKSDPFSYYGLTPNFDVVKLPVFDLTRFGGFGFLIERVSFIFSVAYYALKNEGIFFTRETHLAAVLVAIGKTVIWESHRGEKGLFVKFLALKNTKVVVITNFLKNMYQRRGFDVLLAPDAVNIEQFDISVTSKDAKSRLNLEDYEKIVLYTGHLYSWKGADTLAKAASLLSESLAIFFVGGTPWDIKTFKEKYSKTRNVHIIGSKPHQEMPMYLRAADVLVIPNSSKEDISRFYTSPMKLFEYMASGTPIVASDLPSLREIVDEKMVTFFEPDNEISLAKSIEFCLTDGDSNAKAERAKLRVKEYSWQNRANKILEFIKA